MGLIFNTDESKQVKDIHEHTKLNRISFLSNMRIKETRRQFSNTTWISSVCRSLGLNVTDLRQISVKFGMLVEWSKSVMVEVGTEDSGHQNRVDMMLSAYY